MKLLEHSLHTLYPPSAMPCHLANLSMKNFPKNFVSTRFAVPPPKAQKLVLILVIITQHAVPFTRIIIIMIIIMKLI